MANNTQIAKEIFEACMNKDVAKMRTLFDPNYKLQDPMMKISNLDDMIAMVENCPGDGKMEDLEMISQDDKVVATFTNKFSGNTMRMCSVMTFKNGKLAAEEMFYDTSKIPQDMKDQMANQKAA